MLFNCLDGAFKLHYRLRQPVFWEEKCKSNAWIKSGLSNWISGEGQRGRREDSDHALLSTYALWGWEEGGANNRKAARTVQQFHGHQVLSSLTSTNLAWCQQAPRRVGCEPSHEREQRDALCSCCPFVNSVPGGRKTQCISYFKFQ